MDDQGTGFGLERGDRRDARDFNGGLKAAAG